MPDEPSLGDTIRECFANLAKGNEVQTEKVLEALKPKAPPTTDKETTFWNAYKTLSEEYDREFHKKYGTDLDTSLIFAGLFSAVSSAFIIQIQPELQQDPNEVTQQLLRILIHNANQSLFSDIDLAESNSGTTTTIVIVQSFLYASLFSTLLAALLAVLGKQWLMHYDAAGGRGTLAERGLERQRKYDGLQRWKFTLVMEMFPLLLQLALLLFSAALSVYLSTISCPIAIIVITLTSLGALAYISLLVSAVLYPDSPFQTPLASVLRKVVLRLWGIIPPLPPLLSFPHRYHRRLEQGLSSTWAATRKLLQQPSIFPPLPRFRYDEDLDLPTPNPFATESLPEASPAIPAVLWLIETSTNPDVISTAAGMAADLHWPLHADLDVALDRLRDTFWACFVKHKFKMVHVQGSSIQHAINCGKAYGTMSISSRRKTRELIGFFQVLIPPRAEGTESLQLGQLHSVFNALKGDPRCLRTVGTQSLMQWVLHVLPYTALLFDYPTSHLKIMLDYASASEIGFTKQNYADCLLFLNIMLGFQAHPDTLVLKDKSFAIGFLLEELFKNLSKSLDRNSIRLITAKEMITLANQMTKMSGHKLSKMRVRKQVYDLCATIARVNGWVDVVVAALTFGDLSGYAQLENVSWIYAALEDVHQSNVNAENDWDAAMEERVCCLLKALNDAREFPVPSEKALQVILKALSRDDPHSIPAVKLLCQEKDWFGDINLQPIMQEHNVWSQMGSVIMRNSSQISNHSLKQYILLGEKLSNLIQWTQYIRHNLSHWITIYYKRPIFSEEHLQAPYLSVLEHVWGVKYTGTFHFMKDTEKTFAWTLIALSIGWEDFNFSGRQTLQEFYYLIRCTISTAFKSHNSYGRYYFDISPEFRAAFYTPLGSSLIQAAINAEDMVPGGPTQSDNQDGSLREKTQMSQVLQQATRILDKMGQVLRHESEGEQVDHGEEKARRYWNNLRTHFEEQVDQLEESLKETLGTAEISP